MIVHSLAIMIYVRTAEKRHMLSASAMRSDSIRFGEDSGMAAESSKVDASERNGEAIEFSGWDL